MMMPNYFFILHTFSRRTVNGKDSEGETFCVNTFFMNADKPVEEKQAPSSLQLLTHTQIGVNCSHLCLVRNALLHAKHHNYTQTQAGLS